MPVLQIGPLAVQLPGLLVLLGVWIGSLTLDREAARRGLPAEALSKLVFYALFVGLIGARLGYALRYASAFIEDPLALFSLQPFTLSAPDGTLAATLFAWAYGRRARLPLWATLDALTPMAAVAAVFVALSHLASGDAFGAPSSVPWAVELWGARRHPSQVYELLAAAGVLGYVLTRNRTAPAGWLFLSFVGLSAAGRLVLEAFRGDSVLIVGGIRTAQAAALAVLLAAQFALHRRACRASAEGRLEAPC